MAKKSKKMSDEEIISEVDKRTKKFMKAARAFLATKAGSTEVPVEWEVSVIMLETYYREFLELTMRIEQLDSLTITGRYGETPNPILQVRDKSATRLEILLKQMGITMKSAINLNVVDPKKEESALEKFMKGKVEVR